MLLELENTLELDIRFVSPQWTWSIEFFLSSNEKLQRIFQIN